MSVGDQNSETDPRQDDETGTATATEAKRKLNLSVDITETGPCKKHVKIAIPREEIDRQFDESLKNLRKEAAVPGFRPGRAPRTLVQKRFRKEVAGQVKSTLLMACMEQIDEDYKLNPISQPNLDLDAMDLPEEGSFEFDFDVEVEPEFTLPDYKSLTVKRPVRKITDKDVDGQLKSFTERYAQLVPKLEGGAEVGDFVVADLQFSKGGVQLNQASEIQFRLQPQLRFQDGIVPEVAKALIGAKAGDVRDATAQIGTSSPDPALRGQEIDVRFIVHDLKTMRVPEVDQAFLDGIGFDSEDELRQALRGVLERRVEFQARQEVRKQIVEQLSKEAPFELPPDLVKRQERSTLRRLVEDMRQNGFSDNQLRAREAEVRANAHEVTQRNLKEFFLLSKIAEAEGVKVEEDDLADEIEVIAARTDESPRRIRARLEKEGQMENLATQILERKAIDRILEFITVELEEVTGPAESDEDEAVETLDQTAASADAGEPEAADEPSEA
jgi:trigger factor